MYASKARHQYAPMGLFFSLTPIKLYTIKEWKVKKIVLQDSQINLNMQMSNTQSNIGYRKYTRIRLIFYFTPTTIKLYTMKVYMKNNIFVLQVSWKNLL